MSCRLLCLDVLPISQAGSGSGPFHHRKPRPSLKRRTLDKLLSHSLPSVSVRFFVCFETISLPGFQDARLVLSTEVYRRTDGRLEVGVGRRKGRRGGGVRAVWCRSVGPFLPFPASPLPRREGQNLGKNSSRAARATLHLSVSQERVGRARELGPCALAVKISVVAGREGAAHVGKGPQEG